MILSGGENIASKEVEGTILLNPAVADCAVIGLPDPKWGENVHAVVVLKPGMSLTETELIDFCKANLASYKKPKSVEFVKDLPRNPTGKVLKKELRLKYK
jgi:acyl-CoA synthetase (AMP-forming)/AMP-acid ligase II